MTTTTPAPTTTGHVAAAPPARSATRRLLVAELRLLRRDPITATFVLALPVISMLIIGGAFGTEPDDAFPVNPAHWYVASYVVTAIGATGLVMVPVHLASYRERGVIRRLAASGFPRFSFALAELAIGVVAVLAATVLLLAVAAPVYGVPDVADPVRVVAGILLGTVAFVGLGVLLGSVLPSARAAQAVGLMLFFPSFLLGVGGPPPEVMSPALRQVADVLPLKVLTDAVREPWLGIGDATGSLVVVAVIAVVVVVLAGRRSAL
jgi:ABC-2 type transport system permease protein